MSLERRIEDAERALPTDKAENCQRIIYQICSTKDDVDSAGPSDAQVQAFLEATGRCEKCTTRRCFLIWQPGSGFEPLRE